MTQIGFHRVQTFLRAEQVGVKGADALHDKVASLVPDIVPVEDRADAEVEGHHAQFVRGSEFGNLRCGDRPVVSGATARQDEREAGQGDSPGQRFGLHRLFFLHLGQVRPQPIARGLSVAIREFHQVRFAGDITLAGNSGDEVIGRLHAVTSLGEFVAQMLRTLGPGILRAVANEANAGRLDVGNQLIDFRLRLRIKRQRDRSGEQQREDGSEKLAHEIDVSVWARCSEQPLDRQPAYHLGLDAFHEVRVGLGVVAHFLVALARHPDEAVAIEFDAIRVAAEIALGLSGQTPRQRRTVEEHTHFRVQFARARIEIVGADETNPAVEGKRLRMQAPNARSGRFAKAPLELGAGGRLDLIEFDAGLDQRLAVELVFGVDRHPVGGSQRIGNHDDSHAALAHAGQKLDALLSRHEVRRDEEQLALRFIDDLAQLRGEMRLRLVGGSGHLVRMVVHDRGLSPVVGNASIPDLPGKFTVAQALRVGRSLRGFMVGDECRPLSRRTARASCFVAPARRSESKTGYSNKDRIRRTPPSPRGR